MLPVVDDIDQLPPNASDVHMLLTSTEHIVVKCTYDPHHMNHRQCPAPQDKEVNIAWTEQERQYARNAGVPASLQHFEEMVSLVSLFSHAKLSASTRLRQCTMKEDASLPRHMCVYPWNASGKSSLFKY